MNVRRRRFRQLPAELHEVLKKEIAAATAEDDYQQPVRKKKQQLDETRKVVTHKKKSPNPRYLGGVGERRDS